MRITLNGSIVLSVLLAGCGHAATEVHSPAVAKSAAALTTQATAHAMQAIAAGEAASSAPSADSGDNADADDGPTTDMQLTPLSKDDIALYLQVMHAAADRVRHPSAADMALAQHAKVIVAAGASGKASATPEQDAQVMTDLLMLHGQMDVRIVQERHLDAARYEGIQSAIEDAVPNPATAAGSCGGDCPEAKDNEPPPAASGAALALQHKIESVQAEDTRILAPYKTEIQQLLPVVRNISNPGS